MAIESPREHKPWVVWSDVHVAEVIVGPAHTTFRHRQPNNGVFPLLYNSCRRGRSRSYPPPRGIASRAIWLSVSQDCRPETT
jgi:hypothetical protein